MIFVKISNQYGAAWSPSDMNRRIFILGKTGLIGGTLLEAFRAEGKREVVGFSSDDFDLVSLEQTRHGLNDVGFGDVIFFSAGITRLKEDSHAAMLRNQLMTENLLQALSDKMFAQFILISSIDVFGTLQANVDSAGSVVCESDELRPDDSYGQGKLSAERLCEQFCRQKKIPLAILRFPGVFGPHLNDRTAVGKFIKDALSQGIIQVFGKGDDERDYIFAGDLLPVVNAAIEKKFDGAVNVVHSKSLTILNIARLVEQAVGKTDIIRFTERTIPDPRKKFARFDDSLFRQIYPEICLHSIEQGIQETVAKLATTVPASTISTGKENPMPITKKK